MNFQLRCMGAFLALCVFSSAGAATVSAFTYTPTNPTTGQDILFDGSSSFDTDVLRSIVSWSWDFDNDGQFDDGFSSSENRTWAQILSALGGPTTGNFLVGLRVANDLGAASISQQVVKVTAPVPIPPAVWLFGSALGVMGWMRRKLVD